MLPACSSMRMPARCGAPVRCSSPLGTANPPRDFEVTLRSARSTTNSPSRTKKNSSSLSCLCQWHSPCITPKRTTDPFTWHNVWLYQASVHAATSVERSIHASWEKSPFKCVSCREESGVVQILGPFIANSCRSPLVRHCAIRSARAATIKHPRSSRQSRSAAGIRRILGYSPYSKNRNWLHSGLARAALPEHPIA